MREVHLITVGKMKDLSLKALEDEFKNRINDFQVIIHECKALQENLEREGEVVLKKINDLKKLGPLNCFLLAEKGKTFSSPQFSKWLYGHFEQSTRIALIFGGASGHGQNVQQVVSPKISLSEMTFPHQWARAILMEQLYRAQSIAQNHPYHK